MRGIGERTDDRDLLDGFAERQDVVLVLEEHHRSRCNFALQLAPFRPAQGRVHLRLIHVGMVEEPQLILDLENRQDRRIELSFCHFPCVDQAGKIFRIGQAGHIHV